MDWSSAVASLHAPLPTFRACSALLCPNLVICLLEALFPAEAFFRQFPIVFTVYPIDMSLMIGLGLAELLLQRHAFVVPLPLLLRHGFAGAAPPHAEDRLHAVA